MTKSFSLLKKSQMNSANDVDSWLTVTVITNSYIELKFLLIQLKRKFSSSLNENVPRIFVLKIPYAIIDENADPFERKQLSLYKYHITACVTHVRAFFSGLIGIEKVIHYAEPTKTPY